MKEKTFNRLFNGFILIGMFLSVLIGSYLKLRQGEGNSALMVLSAVGALAGVLSTVLSAGGNIFCFVFGLIDVVIYSYALFDSGNPLTFCLHVFYFIPMEFVGFFMWKKRGADSKSAVKARRLKGIGQWVKVITFFVVVFVACFTLSWVATSKGWIQIEQDPSKIALDAMMTTTNIVALVLMSLAYYEQWYLWLLVNVSSIITWSLLLKNDPQSAYSIVYLIKYIFYLLNSVNGIRIWLKLSKDEISCK